MTLVHKNFIAEGISVVSGVPTSASNAESCDYQESLNLPVAMRDGVMLFADIYIPLPAKHRPVILTRTPYGKDYLKGTEDVEYFLKHGYVVVIQDVRGRFNSEGDFDPYRQEIHDGYDTVEWIATQDWCDGNVGMIGGSYSGQTQWFAASQSPEALKAIIPTESPPGNPFLNEPFYGGVMIMSVLEWHAYMDKRRSDISVLSSLLTSHQPYFDFLPVKKAAQASKASCPWWEDSWLYHSHYDRFWQSCGYEQYWSNMKVAALNISGWWGLNFLGAPRNFVGMRQQGLPKAIRSGQRLVIGPWPHAANSSTTLSGIDFGDLAVTGLSSYSLKFFDYWLKGKKGNRLEEDPCVHIFVTGANQWWATDTWPLPGTTPTPLYLHSQGGANTHNGNGIVNFKKPDIEPDDSFLSDPLAPVYHPWSIGDGPVDDTNATASSSVLCYTSEVLIEPLDVVGNISAVLYASSSAKDCDWHIRLVNVDPEGTARFICHGALRARYREGFDKSRFLNPNETTRFEIDMTAAGIRFLPGHRIRIEIASSWFPRFDRNTQTGAENWMCDEKAPVIAKQIIKHNSSYPSCILLPVISGHGSLEIR